jgi:hypothetical protein
MDSIEMEAPLGRLGYGDVAHVDRIKRPAEERHRVPMPSVRVVGSARVQLSS